MLDALVVDIFLHLVAIGGMKHVDDDELGRIGTQRVAQQTQGSVEVHLGGHQPVIEVQVLLEDAGAQVEGTYAQVPQGGHIDVLRAGIAVGQLIPASVPAAACGSIVGSGNRDLRHIGIVGQALHPVVGNGHATAGQQCECQNLFSHCLMGCYC